MKLEIFPVEGIAEIKKGDDIADVIIKALEANKTTLEDFDILVITQKIVSKAEGKIVQLESRDPQARLKLAEAESVRVLRQRGDLIISETSHGFICANAGVDFSNIEEGSAALLPENPDVSAKKILKKLERKTKQSLGIIISDTFGRPWRKGLTNIAIGCAGIKPIVSYIGTTDSFGMELHATEMAIVDELAGASEMVMGKSDGIPVAVIRGVGEKWFGEGSVQKDIIRLPQEDFFR